MMSAVPFGSPANARATKFAPDASAITARLSIIADTQRQQANLIEQAAADQAEDAARDVTLLAAAILTGLAVSLAATRLIARTITANIDELTDAAAEHFKKLKHLTGIEISCAKATAGLMKHLRELPMEYVALEYGVCSPAAEAIATVKAIPTLRKLSLDAKAFTDADLTAVAGVTQIKELSLSNLELPDTRLSQFQAFAHLKTLTLVRYGKGYPVETQAKVKALLPKVDVKFVK